MSFDVSLAPEVLALVEAIYGDAPPSLVDGLAERLSKASTPHHSQSLWSERDVVLITYADQIRNQETAPLSALKQFLIDEDLADLFGCVHLLPFCPFSSDDGFSVIDYMEVDPNSGTWDDIASLGKHTDLMFDLVLNHCSQFHHWFRGFVDGDPEFEDFFVTADPEQDLSSVTRPRSLPLLTEFPAGDGVKNVWTTFSADQVDLNYANPRVLLKMIDTILEYAHRGARIIRLDAIAYLWKEPGTNCIHLPQTHAVVRLMRYMLDRLAPGTLVLTETNVPHDENVSYFGSGDEAHMVYQFSLPPLLLDAVQAGDTTLLRNWMRDLEPPFENTTFFNFTASHDGIGMRPLEGIASNDRILALADAMRERGGRVNTRRNADGTDSPYELNITYVDAVAGGELIPPAEQAKRFLATQAVMLSLQGVPAVYFHSLVGSPNDQAGVAESGQNRRINRHKYDRDELNDVLSLADQRQALVFSGYKRLLQIRTNQAAFHPQSKQTLIELEGEGLLCFGRGLGDPAAILVLANLSDEPREFQSALLPFSPQNDLLDDTFSSGELVQVMPFQVRWLTA